MDVGVANTTYIHRPMAVNRQDVGEEEAPS